MYLVHVQETHYDTTRNKQAYLKTLSTSFVTENIKQKYYIRTLYASLARRNA